MHTAALTVMFNQTVHQVNEGDDGQFTIELNREADRDIFVTLTKVDGTDSTYSGMVS